MRIKIVLSVLASIVLFGFAGCGTDGKQSKTQQEAATVAAAAGNTESAGAASTKDEIAVIETNKGVIKFKFYTQDAPNTVANFIKLTDKKFYDGLTFHRYEPGFVIQGGDPNGNGSGGPGYQIKAEFNKNKHVAGTVAMARAADPNSAGSQFYICLAPAPFLDNQYTVFGQVTEGMDVVLKLRAGDKMTKVFIEK
jgi:cyclophilin family peptidyl-prolyl cis-trans isomerase